MDWIEKQAVFYRNLALAKNYMAVVHLEDKEDEPFWNGQLQSVKPGRYRYLHYSKSNNGTETRGCEQYLRFRPYLTDRFFICIDSDLRLLKGEEALLQKIILPKLMPILGRTTDVRQTISARDCVNMLKHQTLI